jgi:hypothetical protein
MGVNPLPVMCYTDASGEPPSPQNPLPFYCTYTITLTGQTCSNVSGTDMNNAVPPLPEPKECAHPATLQADGSCTSLCYTCSSSATGSCLVPVTCGTSGAVSASNYLAAESACGAVCADKKKPSSECSDGGVKIGEVDGQPLCLAQKMPDSPECEAVGGHVTGTLNGQPVCSRDESNPKCPDGSLAQGVIGDQIIGCTPLPRCENGTTSPGTVNGVPVCDIHPCPAGTGYINVGDEHKCVTINSVPEKTTNQTSNPGSGTTTETVKTFGPNGEEIITTTSSGRTTTCVGDRCTTTTVSGGGDSGTAETTTTVEQDKSTFCADNPKDANCAEDEEEMDWGAPSDGDGGELPKQESGTSSISPVSVGVSMSCPAPLQLPHNWGEIRFDAACDLADLLTSQ